MVKSIIINEAGGPEVLTIKETKVPKLKDNEIRVRNIAIGINYHDIHYRNGRLKKNLPFVPGFEAAGEIEEIKGDVGNLEVGDRVVYAAAPIGAYTEVRNINHKYVVRIPNTISYEQAAAVLFKGMTAHYLLRRTSFVGNDMSIVVHAAAGGVGSFICQMAKHFGVEVIGTVGSENKIKIAKKNGCQHVINYSKEKFLDKVMEITNGKGVNSVYDSVGKNTIIDSAKCLMTFGLLISFGQTSGPITPFNINLLAKNSLFMTSPSIFHYKKHRYELVMSAGEVFSMLEKGIIKDNISAKYKFEDISQAHKDLESRQTNGSIILLP